MHDLTTLVALEVQEIHAAFERWFRGEDEDLARVEAALADDFAFVTTAGDVVGRADLLASIRQGRGTRALRMRVERATLQWSNESALLATYEEWHEADDHETARRSTVLMTFDEAAPRGLVWRHVHETWMVPPPPAD